MLGLIFREEEFDGCGFESSQIMKKESKVLLDWTLWYWTNWKRKLCEIFFSKPVILLTPKAHNLL